MQGKRNIYWRKAYSKKNGRFLLAAGIATVIVGGIIQSNAHESVNGLQFDFTGSSIAVAGGVIGLAGIITLSNSSSNKKRAATLSFSNHHILIPHTNSFVLRAQPALAFKTKLSQPSLFKK